MFVCIKGNYGYVFLSVSIYTRACLWESCSICCLQIVCGEGSDAKSLVKGANSYLKAVIVTLMEKVFNTVSEKTRAERWDKGKVVLEREGDNTVRGKIGGEE